jgi:monoterpene epsilon-lactone hydrolase
MASTQAHVVSFVLRHTFKPMLSRSTSAHRARAVMDGVVLPAPKSVRITPAEMGGVPGEWVEPTTHTAAAHVLLYLHGGGYFACSPRSHRPITTAFAQHGFRVYAPEYRLAPEHPFPAAVLDAVAAYRAVRADAARPIVIAGDSAGGGLSLATMLKLRDEGNPLPAAAALFSPFTDLTYSGGSRETNERCCSMFHSSGFALAAAFYISMGADPRDPLASPIYGDLRGLPPLLIHVGSAETLLDDSTRLAERARAAGVPVEITIWPVVPHVWQLFRRFVPEGRQSLDQAAAFLARYL